jgi:transposase-like protein
VALTDEQRAMLQLLLEGGQSYEDIGSLLGIGPDEVRSRARSALREMGGADPDARVGLSEYILGQADPIGRADAVRQLQADPETNALAQRLVQQLRLLAPKAQLPDLPEARGGRAPAPPPHPTPPAEPPGAAPPPPSAGPAPATAPPKGPGVASRAAGALSGLGGGGKRRAQILAGAGAAAVLVVVGLLAIGGVFDSGDGGNGSDDCVPLDTSAAQQAGIPTVALTPVRPAAEGDCPPSGQMTLGAAQPQGNQTTQFALQANAVHLSPTTSDERYLLWLYTSDDQAFPLGQQTVDASGNLTGGVPLSAQQVLLLSAFQTIRFSKVTAQEAQQVQQSLRSLQQQGRNARGAVPFVGAPVLEGQISELGLDQLLQQAQGQAGAGGQQGGQGAGSQ